MAKVADKIDIEVTCNCCKRNFILKVPAAGYKRWLNGELIQNALPELKADERELLISNTCGTCWDKMFE